MNIVDEADASLTTLPDHWLVYADAATVAQATVDLILERATQAIADRGAFHLVTAGGTTPMACYRLLADLTSSKANIEWTKWFIYMGDERCLPVDDPERNSLNLDQAWLNLGQIPAQNIFFMPAELGATAAAAAYEKVLKEVSCFDVVMLGMGEDGHTASLFPSHDYPIGQKLVTEFNSPKMPPERVSLSFECLSNARFVMKLVTGAGKQAAVQQWLAGEPLPISQVVGQERTEVLLDFAALPQ